MAGNLKQISGSKSATPNWQRLIFITCKVISLIVAPKLKITLTMIDKRINFSKLFLSEFSCEASELLTRFRNMLKKTDILEEIL